MSPTRTTPAPPIPDEMILAAVDRAERHRTHKRPGVPFDIAIEHLGLTPGSWTTRRVRPQFEALEQTGALKRHRRHSIITWELTSAARERLAKARRTGALPELPEAPQHILWRQAHTLAEKQLDETRHTFIDTLTHATALLQAPSRTDSDTWFELAEHLKEACWRLGATTYCLHEWTEPTDEKPDPETRQMPGDNALPSHERSRREYRRIGRRGIKHW